MAVGHVAVAVARLRRRHLRAARLPAVSWKHSVWRAAARGRELFARGAPLPGDPYGLAVSPAAFARQMELVASCRFGRPVSLGSAALDDSPELCVTFDDGYLDTLTNASPILSRLGLPFSVCVTPGLLDAGRPHLDWRELKVLTEVANCEIGAHGLTHARLDSLDDAALAGELSVSRRRLEEAVGKPVRVMTWPHGAASRRTAAAAKAAGFARA